MASKFLLPKKKRNQSQSHCNSTVRTTKHLKGNHPCLSDSLLTVSVCNLLRTSAIQQVEGCSEVATTRRAKHCVSLEGSLQALYLGLIFTQLKHLHSSSLPQVSRTNLGDEQASLGMSFRCPPACRGEHLEQARVLATLSHSPLVTFGSL